MSFGFVMGVLLSFRKAKQEPTEESHRSLQEAPESHAKVQDTDEAHRALLLEHCESVFHRCYRLLRDKELAYEATQETLTRYFEASKRREIAQPLHYLYRISTNCCLDLLCHYERTLSMEPEEMAVFEKVTGGAVESQLIVHKLLEQFGQESVDLLLYRYVDRMTYIEIGQLLGISDRGVKKRMDKLEKSIRRYLKR